MARTSPRSGGAAELNGELNELAEAAAHLDRALDHLHHRIDRLRGERLSQQHVEGEFLDDEVDFAEILANRGALA